MVNEHSDQTLFVGLKGMHLCSVSVLNRMSHYLHPAHLDKFLSPGSISSFGAGRNLDNKNQSSSALLNQVLVMFGLVVLCCGDCPIHCRMLNSIPHPYPTDVSTPCPHPPTPIPLFLCDN